MRFECNFCCSSIIITEYDYAIFCKDERLLCSKCKEKVKNNINLTS
ncbi:MAG: hypothetical protein NT076_05175 [Candidatus Pacearchaeota archaeon]|nr:hypothetical protein [Candidatus Pacearchaeota archaeon]